MPLFRCIGYYLIRTTIEKKEAMVPSYEAVAIRLMLTPILVKDTATRSCLQETTAAC